jgi:hypothetical protein
MSRRALWMAAIATAATVSLSGGVLSAQKSKLGKPDTGAGTTTAARKYLEGRWGLLSFDVFPPNKPVIHVGGQGSLVYDAFGNMHWEVRVPADAAEPLRLAGIPNDNGVLSMDGRAAIDMQAHTLTYIVGGQPALGAPSAGPLATSRKRHWVVEGNQLTLTTKDTAGKALSIAKWQKLEQQP